MIAFKLVMQLLLLFHQTKNAPTPRINNWANKSVNNGRKWGDLWKSTHAHENEGRVKLTNNVKNKRAHLGYSACIF